MKRGLCFQLIKWKVFYLLPVDPGKPKKSTSDSFCDSASWSRCRILLWSGLSSKQSTEATESNLWRQTLAACLTRSCCKCDYIHKLLSCTGCRPCQCLMLWNGSPFPLLTIWVFSFIMIQSTCWCILLVSVFEPRLLSSLDRNRWIVLNTVQTTDIK